MLSVKNMEANDFSQSGVYARCQDLSPDKANYTYNYLFDPQKFKGEEAFAVVRRATVEAFVRRCKAWVADGDNRRRRRVRTMLLCGHRLGWPQLPEDSWRDIQVHI